MNKNRMRNKKKILCAREFVRVKRKVRRKGCTAVWIQIAKSAFVLYNASGYKKRPPMAGEKRRRRFA